MSITKMGACALFAACGVALGVAPATAAPSRIPYLRQNCKHVNAKYPHGVGRVGAHDKTAGESVTTFRRRNRLYATAMYWNKRFEADKDKIA